MVAILAHPDDAKILAGGTLYQHQQRGDSVAIWSITYTPDSVRGHEGAAGAQRLTAFLLARPPDLVLTHWLDDTYPDHVASVRLVVEALVYYAVAHGLEDVAASRRAFPQVWSCDTYGALGSRGAFDPEWAIVRSAVWAQKHQALAAHQSQTPAHWTARIRRPNAFYGARCHRPYAEGLRRLPLAFVNNLPAYEYLPS